MPGLSTHMVLANEIADGISPTDGDELFHLVNSHRSIYLMGSVAPDTFFFAPDFGPRSVDLLRMMTTAYDLIGAPIQRLVDEYITPLEKRLDQIEDTFDDLTCNLFSAFPSEVDRLTSNLERLGQTVFVSIVTDAVNIFDHMVPPIQRGEDVDGTHPPGPPPQGWYWFDMVHYRHTGDLIQQMWGMADSDAKRAFVLGWATHHAADAIGHATVNTLVGGPYRSHNQRHHFIENLLDVELYDRFRAEELIAAKLHLLLPRGEDIERVDSVTAILDGPNDVPRELEPIFDMLDKAIRATYITAPRRIPNRYLDVEQLNAAYLFTLLGLRSMTSSAIPLPPDPTAEAIDAIEQAWNDFLETAKHSPEPPDLPPGLCVEFWEPDCSFDISNVEAWLDHLWHGVLWLGEVLGWVGDMMANLYQLVQCTATAPVKVYIRGLMGVAHAAAYEMAAFLREGLVMNAIVPPDRDWVRTHPVATRALAIDEGLLISMNSYPHQAPPSNAGFQSFPDTPVEIDATLPAPVELTSQLDQFARGATEDAGLYEEYANSANPAETRAIEFANDMRGFDSVESMSRFIMNALVGGNNVELPNWNLDADRGYGYLAWTVEGAGATVEPPFLRPTPVPDEWVPD